MKNPLLVLTLALLLVFGGAILAWRTQTAGGTVSVRDVRWTASSGTRMSGLLYVPDGASAANPAPGILAIHGYINSRETQSGFAIEFARRGFVVLALDQTGHGYSDPPAFAQGFGGPAGLAYLRSLDFVDTRNVGLSGHSMGGWASGMAASANPDDYRSMVLAGSSTGSSGVPPGTPEWPRNLAVIWSLWDEFSPTMWGTPVSAEVGSTPKMKALFGTEEDVLPRTVYGSIADGTARVLYQPRTNHPGDHLSSEAIGNAVQWFQLTLDGGNPLPPSDQTWFRKELGTLLGVVGMVLLLFPVGALLLRSDWFAELRREPIAAPRGGSGSWWMAAAITALLGPLTLFRFKDLPRTLDWSVGPWFPQSITNSVIAWTTALGLITLVLLLGWHFLGARERPEWGDAYGLTWNGRVRGGLLLKSLLLALLIATAGYLTLAVTDLLFTTDFRFWVFAIKPMSALHLRMALVYFLPFAFYFLLLNVVLHAQLRRTEWSLRRSMFANVAILVVGYLGLYAYQYVPLFTRGALANPEEPLWTIISYQLLPLMIIVGLILTYFNRRTGTVYVGSFLAAMLISWIVVASQATHFAFGS